MMVGMEEEEKEDMKMVAGRMLVNIQPDHIFDHTEMLMAAAVVVVDVVKVVVVEEG